MYIPKPPISNRKVERLSVFNMLGRFTDEEITENQIYSFTPYRSTFFSSNKPMSISISYRCCTSNGRYIGEYTEDSLDFYFKTIEESRDEKLNSIGI